MPQSPTGTQGEADRLRALARLDALDAPTEPYFEQLASLAASLCGTPFAAIGFIAEERQWLMAAHGPLAGREFPRAISMCAHTIAYESLHEVEDASQDPRFASNPFVTDAPHVRHYAAVPLRTHDGHAVGTLCVFSDRPGRLKPGARRALESLASIAMHALEQRAEQRRALGADPFQHLYHNAPVIMALVDDQGRLLSVTEHWLEVFGCRRDQAIGHSIGDFMTAGSRRKADRHVRPKFLKSGRVDNVRYRFVSRAGGTFEGELSARRTPDAQGRMRTVAVIFDVTATRNAQRALQGVNDRLTTTLNSIGEGVLSTNADGTVRYLNPAGRRLLGWCGDDALGRPSREVYRRCEQGGAGDQELDHLAHGADADSEGDEPSPARSATAVLHTRTGEPLTVEETLTPMRGADGRVSGAVLVFRDVTAQRQLQQQISFQARHDALTGLYNRYEFERRLREAIASTRDGDLTHGLMYLDLDRFKQVNDRAGHAAGDSLLQQLSVRLQSVLRRGDTVARLGGDEFGVLLENCTMERAIILANRLRECVRGFRYSAQGHQFTVGVSIGLVPITAEPIDVSTALRRADDACYVAKHHGRNQVRVHTPGGVDAVSAPVPRRSSDAPGQGLGLASQRVLPLTARARSHTPPHRMFVAVRPAAAALQAAPSHQGTSDRTPPNLATADLWTIDQLRRAVRQRAPALDEIAVLSLRLSPISLEREALMETALALLDDTHFSPHSCCFEISERAARSAPKETQELLRLLGERGCRFTLCEAFDTLAEPSLLRELPVSYLSLDERLIGGLRRESLYRPGVRALAEIARSMGIYSIAPAVDDEETLEAVRSLGIDFAHGQAIAPARPLLVAPSSAGTGVLGSSSGGDRRLP